MPTDTRLVVRQYFDPSEANFKVTQGNILDEQGEQVRFNALYEENMHLLHHFFHTLGYGGMIVLLRPTVEAVNTPSGPIAYRHTIGVQAVVVDKWSGSGGVSLLASKVLDSFGAEIRRVIRTNLSGSMKLSTRESQAVEQVGSLLWAHTVYVEYTQYVTSY